MVRGRVPPSEAVNAADFLCHLDAKVASVRASTDNAPPPSFSSPPGCSIVEFRLLSVANVVALVQKLLYKQCDSDIIPTHLLKDCVDILDPFLVDMFNRSLWPGSVPTVFKPAYVSPLSKKPDLDAADVRSSGPISNLLVLSKLLQRLVVRQLVDYLSAADLLLQWSCHDWTAATQHWPVCHRQLSHLYNGHRTRQLAWFSSWAPASMSRHICYSCTGYQYTGTSGSNCAALCTLSSTGRVQRICQTLLSPSVQAVHVLDYVPPRRRTSHCHGCAQSSTNVHLARLDNDDEDTSVFAELP